MSTWYNGNDLGDPYRQQWKLNIRRKGQNIKNNGEGGLLHRRFNQAREITTTLFVPATVGSRLLQEIQKCEEHVGRNMDWGIKLLERSGTALSSLFTRRFPINEGCPFGEACRVCEGDAIKCTPRGVVYRAVCEDCERKKKESSEEVGSEGGSVAEPRDKADYTYIGESGRNLRLRVREHMRGLDNLNKGSFQLNHWMDAHGCSVEPPTFRFELIGSYSGALARQLAEALWIIKEGGLNRKYEFRLNEICRLQNGCNDREKEKEVMKNSRERRAAEENLYYFVSVMKNCFVPQCLNQRVIYRKRSTEDRDCGQQLSSGRKKKQKMDFSTPRCPAKLLPPEGDISPIDGLLHNASSDSGGQASGTNAGHTTNVSLGMDDLKVTPRKSRNESSEVRRTFHMTVRLERNLFKYGLLKRYNSEPENLQELIDNVFYKFAKPFGQGNVLSRSISLPRLGDLTLDELSSNPSFGNGSKDEQGASKEAQEPVPQSPEAVLIHRLKRILSPEDGAIMGTASKHQVMEEASPELKVRAADVDREYDIFSRQNKQEVNPVDPELGERIIKTPKRRLSEIKIEEQKESSMSLWKQLMEKNNKLESSEVKSPRTRSVESPRGHMDARKRCNSMPKKLGRKKKLEQVGDSATNVVRGRKKIFETPKGQRLISKFFTPPRQAEEETNDEL